MPSVGKPARIHEREVSAGLRGNGAVSDEVSGEPVVDEGRPRALVSTGTVLGKFVLA